ERETDQDVRRDRIASARGVGISLCRVDQSAKHERQCRRKEAREDRDGDDGGCSAAVQPPRVPETEPEIASELLESHELSLARAELGGNGFRHPSARRVRQRRRPESGTGRHPLEFPWLVHDLSMSGFSEIRPRPWRLPPPRY